VAVPVSIRELAAPPDGGAALSYPRFWQRWADDATIHGIGAFAGDALVGLAMCSAPGDIAGVRSVRLLSVAVDPALRRTGIATRLIAAAAASAGQRGAERLTALYSSRSAGSPVVERLLAATGWSQPIAAEYRVGARAGVVARGAGDFARPFAEMRRRGLSIEAWETVTAADEARIRDLVDSGVCPPAYVPYPALDQADRAFSVAIRNGGVVAGWILATREGPETVCYTNGWVREPHQRMGWLVAGVFEIGTRQRALLGPDTFAVCATGGGNSAMHAFMNRRLQPYLSWTERRSIAHLALT
jgi:GNAT superfamily N-acetyltransferase